MLDTVERTVPRSIQQANAVQQNLEQKQAAQLLQTRRLALAEQGKPSAWPVSSRQMTSSFGYRSDPFTGKSAFHSGMDIAGQTGDPVYAAGAGTVLEAASSGARGKCIIIQHPDGFQSWYMHLSGMQVTPGNESVKDRPSAFWEIREEARGLIFIFRSSSIVSLSIRYCMYNDIFQNPYNKRMEANNMFKDSKKSCPHL